MSNLVDYAKSELARIGGGDDPMQKAMNDHIVKMVETFSEEEHSGFSAAYAIAQLEKLLRFEPLSPLTGDDDEWTEYAHEKWQNKRCSRVFKDADGRAYDSEGKVFREPDGAAFTNFKSRVYVTFPYVPAREYVEVPGRSEA